MTAFRRTVAGIVFLSSPLVFAQGSNAHLNPIALGVAHPAYNLASAENPAGVAYARGLFLNPYISTTSSFSNITAGAHLGSGMRGFAVMAGADISLGLGSAISIPYAVGSILGRGLAIGLGGSITGMQHNLGLIFNPIGKFRIGAVWGNFIYPATSSLAAGVAFELGRAVSMGVDFGTTVLFQSVTITPGILIGSPGFSIQGSYSLALPSTFGSGNFQGGAQILLGDFTLQLLYNTFNTFYAGLILKI